jgi:hypothetical protein
LSSMPYWTSLARVRCRNTTSRPSSVSLHTTTHKQQQQQQVSAILTGTVLSQRTQTSYSIVHQVFCSQGRCPNMRLLYKLNDCPTLLAHTR